VPRSERSEAWIGRIPKLTVRVRFPSPALIIPAQLTGMICLIPHPAAVALCASVPAACPDGRGGLSAVSASNGQYGRSGRFSMSPALIRQGVAADQAVVGGSDHDRFEQPVRLGRSDGPGSCGGSARRRGTSAPVMPAMVRAAKAGVR